MAGLFGADGAVQKGTARWAEYFFLMPPLEGPNGDKSPAKDPWNIFYPGMMVTDRCSDPNLAVALYNYMIDFEVSMMATSAPRERHGMTLTPTASPCAATKQSINCW